MESHLLGTHGACDVVGDGVNRETEMRWLGLCVRCRSTSAMEPPSEGGTDALFPAVPRGPLDAWRARASFGWKELALFWEGEDVLRLKVRPG